MGFFYAVARGRQVGVFGTWDDCKPHVLNFHEARYKKFKTYSEAVEFIEQNRDSVSRSSTSYSSSMGNRVPAQRIAPSVAAMSKLFCFGSKLCGFICGFKEESSVEGTKIALGLT